MLDASILEAKRKVDALTDEEVFQSWRFTPVGDPRLQGSEGVFLQARLMSLRTNRPAEYTRISKKIGWKE